MTDEQHKELMAAIEGLGDKLTSNEIEWCRAVRTAAQIVGHRMTVNNIAAEKWEVEEDITAAAEIIFLCYGYGYGNLYEINNRVEVDA